MSNHLTRLIQRARGADPAVRPVIAPLFASTGAAVSRLAEAEGGVVDEVLQTAASVVGGPPLASHNVPMMASTIKETGSHGAAPLVGGAASASQTVASTIREAVSHTVAPLLRRIDVAQPQDALKAGSTVRRRSGASSGDQSAAAEAPPVAVATAFEQRSVPIASRAVRLAQAPTGDEPREPTVILANLAAVVPAVQDGGRIEQPRLSDADASRLIGQLRALGGRAAQQHRAADSESTQTIVKVTIGRIEVRAVHPAAPVTAPVRHREPVRPSVSLHAYLNKRQGDRR